MKKYRYFFPAMSIVICMFVLSGCAYGDGVFESPNDNGVISLAVTTVSPSHERHERGNTPGNIANRGYLAQSGDFIFYFLLTETESQLIKSNTDGSDRQVIFSGSRNSRSTFSNEIKYINVVDGWVYFFEAATRTLHRVRTDGTDLEILAVAEEVSVRVGGRDLENDSFSSVQVVDGWIYFADEYLRPNRMRTDGSEREVLLEKRVRNLQVDDGWIFYLASRMDYTIYKMRLDGTEQTGLTDIPTTFFIVDEGWVFIARLNEYYHHLKANIYRMSRDGTVIHRLCNGNTSILGFFGLYDGWIYYDPWFDVGIFRLYKISINGGERHLISEYTDAGLFVNVTGDWIYHLGGSCCCLGGIGGGFYKMRTDGTARERLFYHFARD